MSQGRNNSLLTESTLPKMYKQGMTYGYKVSLLEDWFYFTVNIYLW